MSKLFSISDIVKRTVSAVIGEDAANSAMENDSLMPWSSIQHLHIIIALENALDIEFGDEQLSRITNYSSLVEVAEEASSK